MTPAGKKTTKKICTLCYGTGFISHPKGMKVPCPHGCNTSYSSHR